MFIELHQKKNGIPVFVNSEHIQLFAAADEETTFVYFKSAEYYIEVNESCEEIKMMLTDRLVADLKKSEVRDLLDKMIDRLEKCL